MAEKLKTCLTMRDYEKRICDFMKFPSPFNKNNIMLIVFNEENREIFPYITHFTIPPIFVLCRYPVFWCNCSAFIFGKTNVKILPLPGVDSTQMVPPCCSTAFLTIASPIPVPSYSSWVCSR